MRCRRDVPRVGYPAHGWSWTGVTYYLISLFENQSCNTYVERDPYRLLGLCHFQLSTIPQTQLSVLLPKVLSPANHTLFLKSVLISLWHRSTPCVWGLWALLFWELLLPSADIFTFLLLFQAQTQCYAVKDDWGTKPKLFMGLFPQYFLVREGFLLQLVNPYITVLTALLSVLKVSAHGLWFVTDFEWLCFRLQVSPGAV